METTSKIIEYQEGRCIEYSNENFLHRLDGPATEYISGPANGYKAWYINGMRHNEKGPAVIWENGDAEYYFRGRYYIEILNDIQWIKKVKELKWKSILK